ncbi:MULTISPECIES: 1-aminocyclopropane-1-carboxylate deaminase/D-cysteine desulfhydrase [unclassified Sphingobacterium]|uniref:1-aminocyclopropane-1-carboxylate deaminase/D-cysteine desulfhydrase n=1 Tax=unclassified Sphingobacterium TaxID=2609468 RepID=UPI0025F6F44F|nr:MULTISPECIES: pyridoxal-phosphate dependent enzyme [unclassified Sphingobacterium]
MKQFSLNLFSFNVMLPFKIHSPETELHLPAWEKKHVKVTLKRDDFIHPFISGNKWRKLKYNLAEAIRLQKNHLVTFGGAWSNHLLATACAGASFKFRTTAFVRGEEGVNNPVLAMCRLFGMQLIYVDRESYRNKENLYERYFGQDPTTFYIHEGGYGTLGAKGCAELVDELQQEYQHIFTACGTGTTLAGIANAIDKRDALTRVHGIPVLKNGGFIQAEVDQLYPNITAPILHLNYHFGGYAKATADLLSFVQNFVTTTGILIEPTYTGKLLYAVDDLIKNDYFTPADKILVVHTGGLTGILGMYERFNFIDVHQ